MTPEQIRDAITPLISPLQTSLTSLQTELASQKAELQALKAAGTPKPETPKEDSKNDLAAALIAGLAEVMKPVIEGQTKIVEAVSKKETSEPTGVRRSLAFTGADFRTKYRFGAEDIDLNSSAGCQKLIDDIHASNLPNAKKEQMLGPLGAQKRLLQRQEFTDGGAN